MNEQTSQAASEDVVPAVFVWTAGLLGIVVVGAVDYLTGLELRASPLYYVPIGLMAWYRGRSAALIMAALSTVSWFVANRLADAQAFALDIWVENTLLIGTSLAAGGLLIAMLRVALTREKRFDRIDPLTSLLNRRAWGCPVHC